MIQKTKWFKRNLIIVLIIIVSINYVKADLLTSIRPLGFIASAIADGITQTHVLLPNGASPHNYALKPSDIQRLHQADLVIWISPEMEVFLTKLTQQIDSHNNLILANVPTIHNLLIPGNNNDNIKLLKIKQSPQQHNNRSNIAITTHTILEKYIHHHYSQYNFHIWLSPIIAKSIAIAIHSKLLLQYPKNKNRLDINLRRFEETLQQTQKNIFLMLKPIHGKGYFVFHDAYSYFEKYFGLTPLGYLTINPEIQPGAYHLHKIRTQLAQPKVIFTEPQFRPAVISAIVQGTKIREGTLDPLGSSIALGADSYNKFLTQLSQQYLSCLNRD
ncbi:High-affinity zinc uptake system protein ZnuA [Candidatus Profftia lariciata]|uniref:zinc ABC transporter substrate-binding protein ZnuA n=1 Tax=Candidatus Profftia lariciata TaxID=1987921 RepID=UPI001D002842|nr:zinc ABC transporter substrate-binding protein ZnuA [Candidatus Profftia lariciata]UDG81610.1 High-affinity zinc uptake system protein ZnuA [Candidatus Profftia lariciata]